MIAALASCAIGTDPCDDSQSVLVALPWWAVAITAVGAVLLIAGFIALLVRAGRHRPWD